MKKGSFLPRLSVNRPITIIMTLTAILVVGIIAYTKITVELLPPGFTPPFLHVRVPYPNSNPYEIEEQITRPVEEVLQTVRNVTNVNSTSNSDGSSIFISFRQSADMTLAYNQVRDRMERVMSELPSDVERYYVNKFSDSAEPVLFFGIILDDYFADPYYLIDTYVKKKLERIDGVANVELGGIDEKMILIDLDQEKIRALKVDIFPLVQNLQRDNFAMPSGYISEGGRKIYIRSLSKFSDLDDIRNLKVRGTDITLNDIATVRYDVPEKRWIQRINKKPAIRVAVYKESMANTLDISADALSILEEQIMTDPVLSGMTFQVFFNQGSFIQGAIDNLAEAGLWGGMFAFLILLFFLRRVRMTLLITLGIPLSLVITVVVLYFIGWSINLITLMGMMVCVGLVIDNSIVIVENIYRRRLMGDDPRTAAITGTSEVSTAITLATFTTIVVFLPLILMNDNSGMRFYMLRIGVPIISALLGSLLVALVFIPLIANRLPIKGHIKESRVIASGRVLYERILRWTMSHRLDTAFIALAVIISIQYPMNNVEKTDSSEGNINDFRLFIEMPDNYNLNEADQLMTALEDFLYEKKDQYSITTVDTRFMYNWGMIRVYLKPVENSAWWYVFYKNTRRTIGIPVDWVLTRDEILTNIKETIPQFPGVKVRTRWFEDDQDDKAVSVYVYGRDTQTLIPLAAEVERRLKTVPDFINIETDLQETSNEVHLVINRVLARKYGVSPEEIAGIVSYFIRGINLPDYHSDEKEINIRLQLEKEDRETLHQLKAITVTTSSGKELPLSTFVQFKIEEGLGSIRRLNGRTYLAVKGYTPEENVESLYKKIDRVMAGFEMPRGYTWDKGNRFSIFQDQNMAQNFAMILAVTMVFLLMGVLFESFVLPLSIIVCIPFAFFGGFWALYITKTPFDIMAGIGLIILIGVVVNNAIVLVDLINRFRKEGLSRTEAIIEAGKHRFRPILMTAFTTIFGLVPMALGNSSLIGIPYAPMGRIIMGGIFTSTFFTLVFVPLAYTYFDDLRQFTQGFSHRVIRRFKA